MRDEDRNEMLEADDKYESYRLGYKRGHDRGYEFAKQQDRSELLDLKAALIRRDEQIDQLSDEIIGRGKHIKQLSQEVKTLKIAHGVTESMLKIAYNDITAFIHSEDRMKEEIRDLKTGCRAADVVITQLQGRPF